MFPLRYRGKMQAIKDGGLFESMSKCESVEAPKTGMSLLEHTYNWTEDTSSNVFATNILHVFIC